MIWWWVKSAVVSPKCGCFNNIPETVDLEGSWKFWPMLWYTRDEPLLLIPRNQTGLKETCQDMQVIKDGKGSQALVVDKPVGEVRYYVFLICLSFEYNVYILWVWDHLDHYTMFLVVGFGSNYPNLGPLSCWLQKRSLAQFKLVAELVAGEFTPDSRTLTVIA